MLASELALAGVKTTVIERLKRRCHIPKRLSCIRAHLSFCHERHIGTLFGKRDEGVFRPFFHAGYTAGFFSAGYEAELFVNARLRQKRSGFWRSMHQVLAQTSSAGRKRWLSPRRMTEWRRCSGTKAVSALFTAYMPRVQTEREHCQETGGHRFFGH